MRSSRLAWMLALSLVGCEASLDVGPAGPRRSPPSTVGTAGIQLTPPEGTGERALRCEPDHAPLRRLDHHEYARTIEDLFDGLGAPAVEVPPDARRAGFTNNYEVLAPSALLIEQYYRNAGLVAAAVAPNLVARAACATPDDECFRRIVTELGRRAYRRPLTPEEIDAYASIYASPAVAGDMRFAVELAVQTLLQSPHFLYRPELGGADGTITQHEIASRLSYFVWGTMPDDALLEAADRDELRGSALEMQVSRMLTDPRARDGLLTATVEWLELGRLATRLKNEEYEFTPDVRARLRESIEMFLWERVFSETGSIDELLTGRGAYVDSLIGPLFGVTDAGSELEYRDLEHRAGILTHPAILASYGYGDYGSPVLRGVFVLSEILCDAPSPPPAGVPMSPPPLADASGEPLTNRAGYSLMTQSSPGCAACHDIINPIGFAFEGYDTVGAFRTSDRGQPIDASGATSGFTAGQNFEFRDAIELAEQLGESRRVRACIVDRWVRYATGSGSLAYDPCLRESLQQIVERPGASLRDLVIAIALDPRFVAAEVVR